MNATKMDALLSTLLKTAPADLAPEKRLTHAADCERRLTLGELFYEATLGGDIFAALSIGTEGDAALDTLVFTWGALLEHYQAVVAIDFLTPTQFRRLNETSPSRQEHTLELWRTKYAQGVS